MQSNQLQQDPASRSLNGDLPRRRFLTVASGSALAGLLGSYGTFACMLGEFVYPAANKSKGWLFVCTVDHLAEGEALDFTSPTGAKVVVARQGAGTAGEDFLALPSFCPHLGCRVHWESQNDRFFCPCHSTFFNQFSCSLTPINVSRGGIRPSSPSFSSLPAKNGLWSS